MYAEKLKQLAATAESQAAAGARARARATWSEALVLLPVGSQQHTAIASHIAELERAVDSTPAAQQGEPADARPWWKRGVAAGAAIVLFALSKLKFLLLGLSKAGTFFSMFAFFGLYWSIYGWPFAAGLVISIYIHEMGHVYEIRKAGIHAGAPIFIPGVGALIRLQQHISDPRVDARIGLAGPVWGLGAAVAALGVYEWTGRPIWGAIAHLGAWINLFNLVPIWQLDGSRAFHALDRFQRWAIVGTLAVAYLLTHQGLLLIIGAVAIYRALQQAVTEPDWRAFATFMVLIGALTWIASMSPALQ